MATGIGDVTARVAASKLLRKHLCDGVNAEDLLAMLADCDDKAMSQGMVLCQEGDKGDTLFILISGSVRVLKRDARGVERELVTLKAPALLGHMSLIDGSARSASCIVESAARVVVMDRQVYDHRIQELGPPGTALRRLLLSSLTQQLVRGNTQLGELLVEPEENDLTPEADSAALLRTSGVLRGWSVDDEMEEMLDAVEVVVTEDDKRRLAEQKYGQ